MEVAVERLAKKDMVTVLFMNLVEQFGPYSEWEHPDYPSVARLGEFRAFLTEYRKAGLTLPLTYVAWATGGYVRRWPEFTVFRVVQDIALEAGFITPADAQDRSAVLH
jgi:hypothetical protein